MFLLYNLAVHPEWQERVREEVQESVERQGVSIFNFFFFLKLVL